MKSFRIQDPSTFGALKKKQNPFKQLGPSTNAHVGRPVLACASTDYALMSDQLAMNMRNPP